jgi:arylsulfatase A-like enzyme
MSFARGVLMMAAAVASLGSLCADAAIASDEPEQASSAEAARSQSDPERRPNVLLYVVCSLRADGLGNYGNFRARTPNADALGHDGTLFVNSYAPSSWTRASLGSILTGMYPDVHRAQDRNDALADSATLLSERFAEQGWTTGAIVTSPNVGSFYGFSQGFGDFVELYDRRKRGFVSAWEQTTRSDQATKQAIRWIDAAARPFLLLVLTVDPHWPYDPLAKMRRRRGDDLIPGQRDGLEHTRTDLESMRAMYQAQVEFTDSSFGKLLDHLRAEQLYDDTIVVFTSDHGEEFGERDRSLHGETLYEESLRVPLIIRYPKGMPVAERIERPALLVDIAPTVLELAGLAGDDTFDGSSLTPGHEAVERSFYATLDLDRNHVKAITRYPWKLIWNQRTDEVQLFNLQLDEQELWNLVRKHPRLARRLRAELDARFQQSAKPDSGGSSPSVEGRKP